MDSEAGPPIENPHTDVYGLLELFGGLSEEPSRCPCRVQKPMVL